MCWALPRLLPLYALLDDVLGADILRAVFGGEGVVLRAAGGFGACLVFGRFGSGLACGSQTVAPPNLCRDIPTGGAVETSGTSLLGPSSD